MSRYVSYRDFEKEFCHQPPAISHKLAEDWRLATED
jgi:hypothetical protein